MPRAFHGKPPNRWLRNHSASPRPKASANTRLPSGDHNARASAKPAAGNRARTAGTPRTPKGDAQAKRSASDQKGRAEPPQTGHEVAEPQAQPARAAAQRVATGP